MPNRPCCSAGSPKRDTCSSGWLRSDYHPGDALIFAGETLHAGVPNRSEAIRLSADVRYQPAGSPLHWEAKQPIARTQAYFGDILSALDELQAGPGHFERAWEAMRVAGPDPDRGVRERVEQILAELRKTLSEVVRALRRPSTCRARSLWRSDARGASDGLPGCYS